MSSHGFPDQLAQGRLASLGLQHPVRKATWRHDDQVVVRFPKKLRFLRNAFSLMRTGQHEINLMDQEEDVGQ